jgi:uncharacterized protein (DUF2062 family)
LPIAIGVSVPLRLDATLTYAATYISNPVTLPLLLILEAKLGAALLSEPVIDLTNPSISHALGQLGLGALVVGVALGAFGGGLAALLVHFRRRRLQTSGPSADVT